MLITQNDLRLVSRKEHFVHTTHAPTFNFDTRIAPKKNARRFLVRGEELTLEQVIDKYNVTKHYNTITGRLRKGEELLDILPELRVH